MEQARQADDARLSPEEIADIRKNMAIRGLVEIYCQACSSDMQPELARKHKDGMITCRPCYLCNETDAEQDEIDLSIKEDFPSDYARMFKAE